MATATHTQRDLAFLIAQGMLDGFNRHYRLFREISRHAKSLFESGDWHGLQRISRERIAFYDKRVIECEQYLRRRYDTDALDDAIWQQVKLHYIGLLSNHRQPELAETVRKRFHRHHADLLDEQFWNLTKSRIAAGHVEDVFPYPESNRFRNRNPASAAGQE